MKSFLQSLPGVSYVQPDYPVKLLNDFKVTDPILREMITERMKNSPFPMPTNGKTQDNPAIPPLVKTEAMELIRTLTNNGG